MVHSNLLYSCRHPACAIPNPAKLPFLLVNIVEIMAQPAQPIAPGDMEKNNVYEGHGTEQDPFIVEFQEGDPENPMNWGKIRRWFIACIVTLSVFVVTFTSSAYTESSVEVLKEFNVSTEVFVVGVSVYVLGFAIGPAFWAPLVSMPLYKSLELY